MKNYLIEQMQSVDFTEWNYKKEDFDTVLKMLNVVREIFEKEKPQFLYSNSYKKKGLIDWMQGGCNSVPVAFYRDEIFSLLCSVETGAFACSEFDVFEIWYVSLSKHLFDLLYKGVQHHERNNNGLY